MQLRETSQLPAFMTYNKEAELENLIIEPQPITPFVKFKSDQGLLLIKGKSMSEDALDFYAPIVTIVDNYLNQAEKLTCYLYFKEFNLATAKSLFHLFKTLSEHHILGKRITINWFADWHNNEMLQTGIDYADIYDLKINILPI